MNKKISFAFEEITGKGLVEFYDAVAYKLGYNPEAVCYDCRKLTVSKSVQDVWYHEFQNEGMNPSQITMLLLMSGPKVDQNLQNYDVEVFDGFCEVRPNWNPKTTEDVGTVNKPTK